MLFNFTPGISGQALAGLISLASCPGGYRLPCKACCKATLEQDFWSEETLEHVGIYRQAGYEAGSPDVGGGGFGTNNLYAQYNTEDRGSRANQGYSGL